MRGADGCKARHIFCFKAQFFIIRRHEERLSGRDAMRNWCREYLKDAMRNWCRECLNDAMRNWCHVSEKRPLFLPSHKKEIFFSSNEE